MSEATARESAVGTSNGSAPKADELAATALEQGASDIHIKSGSAPLIRLHGKLERMVEKYPVLSADDTQALLDSVIPTGRRKEFDETGEADFSWTPGVGSVRNTRFRVSAFRQRDDVSMVLRQIPHVIPEIETLGLPPAVIGLAGEMRGLVLVVGATGSGKSTTLAALIDRINRTRQQHIVTIEDPIEFLHQDRESAVNQREVGRDTPSFSQALRRVLRQDPDVILVGEIRDHDTAQIALSAAETGHLVLSTLHTNDATETINRLLDLYPAAERSSARSMLSSTLQGVVAQRLLKTKDGSGRVAVCEVLLGTGRARDFIRDERKTDQLEKVMEEGTFYGMTTFDSSLVDLVKNGSISYDTALEASTSPQNFRLKAKAQNVLPPNDAERAQERARVREAASGDPSKPKAGSRLGRSLERRNSGRAEDASHNPASSPAASLRRSGNRDTAQPAARVVETSNEPRPAADLVDATARRFAQGEGVPGRGERRSRRTPVESSSGIEPSGGEDELSFDLDSSAPYSSEVVADGVETSSEIEEDVDTEARVAPEHEDTRPVRRLLHRQDEGDETVSAGRFVQQESADHDDHEDEDEDEDEQHDSEDSFNDEDDDPMGLGLSGDDLSFSDDNSEDVAGGTTGTHPEPPPRRSLRRDERGYSMLELLTVILIIGVGTAVAAVGFSYLTSKGKVAASADQAVGDLRLLHANSTSQLVDWRFVYKPGTSEYWLQPLNTTYDNVDPKRPGHDVALRHTLDNDGSSTNDLFKVRNLPPGTLFSPVLAVGNNPDSSAPAGVWITATSDAHPTGPQPADTYTVELNAQGSASTLTGAAPSSFKVITEGCAPDDESCQRIIEIDATSARVSIKKPLPGGGF